MGRVVSLLAADGPKGHFSRTSYNARQKVTLYGKGTVVGPALLPRGQWVESVTGILGKAQGCHMSLSLCLVFPKFKPPLP